MKREFKCTKCGNNDVSVKLKDYISYTLHDERCDEFLSCYCKNCGYRWHEKPSDKLVQKDIKKESILINSHEDLEKAIKNICYLFRTVDIKDEKQAEEEIKLIWLHFSEKMEQTIKALEFIADEVACSGMVHLLKYINDTLNELR